MTSGPAQNKKPRGSKLDAKKSAEYRSDIAESESWDTSGWSTWIVAGRVLPERCDVNVPAMISHAVGAGGRHRVRIQVTRSHILAVCWSERGDVSVPEITEAVRSALAFPVDYIAYQNRGAYEIILDVCMNTQGGQALPIPVNEPTFEGDNEGLCFDAKSDKSKLPIPFEEAGRVPELPTALHDLTSAVRYPRRTFEYCRMAVEVVRRYFDPATVQGHTERWREGERALCQALRIERKSLQALDAVAARSRHGELVYSISWAMRKQALEFAWELVARFISHLQGKPSDSWKMLDVRFED
jgi:hypothetical protein